MNEVVGGVVMALFTTTLKSATGRVDHGLRVFGCAQFPTPQNVHKYSMIVNSDGLVGY